MKTLPYIIAFTICILCLLGCRDNQGGLADQQEDGDATETIFSIAPFNADSFILILPQTLDTITVYQDQIEVISFKTLDFDADTALSIDLFINSESYQIFWPSQENVDGLKRNDIPPSFLRQRLADGTLSEETFVIYNLALFLAGPGQSTIFTKKDDTPPAETKSMGFGDVLRARMKARSSPDSAVAGGE